MSTPTMNHTDSMFDTIAQALQSGSYPGGGTPIVGDGTQDLAFLMTSAVRAAAERRPQVVASKQPVFSTAPDPSVVSKDWLSGLGHLIATTVPIIVSSLSKDFTTPAQTVEQALAEVPAARRADKDWVDLTAQILSTIVPAAIDALRGTKEFDPSGLPDISVPAGKDKNFWSDAWDVVKKVGPALITAAVAAL